MSAAVTEARPTLLVVDDEIINVDILLEALGKNYLVHVATDGESALKSVKETQPDLILLDIMMPDMNGLEVCRRLKDDPLLRDIPIIFLSALKDTAAKLQGFSAGGVDFVTKPFQFEEVNARVKAHLELRRQKRELQRSYDKLSELETLRDSLVHMIVHDMRTPLALILGNLELAKSDDLPKDAAVCLKDAMMSTNTIIAMVSTLLDISKLEAGQMTLDYSEVDIRELVGEAIRMIEPVKGQRRLTITAPDEMDSLAGDAPLLRRVLQNLIGNALKFTDYEAGTITVRIETAAQDNVRVSVVDNGTGIPPEYREKVFDKFCQVTTRKQGHLNSTGLGLTLCKLAVEAHGGRIGLESELGKGSTFWFELPKKREN